MIFSVALFKILKYWENLKIYIEKGLVDYIMLHPNGRILYYPLKRG